MFLLRELRTLYAQEVRVNRPLSISLRLFCTMLVCLLGVQESVKDIYTYVREALAEPAAEFYLYTSPPKLVSRSYLGKLQHDGVFY